MSQRYDLGLEGGVAPIPEDLEEDLGALALAGELRVRPWELPTVPRRYVTAARVRLEVRHIQAERRRAEEEAAAKRRKRSR